MCTQLCTQADDTHLVGKLVDSSFPQYLLLGCPCASTERIPGGFVVPEHPRRLLRWIGRKERSQRRLDGRRLAGAHLHISTDPIDSRGNKRAQKVPLAVVLRKLRAVAFEDNNQGINLQSRPRCGPFLTPPSLRRSIRGALGGLLSLALASGGRTLW